MPLTPRDVADKQFRRNFRGYDVDQVDAFLDEVEAEIRRLMTAAATAPSPKTAADAAAAPAAAGPAPATATPAGEPPLATLEGQEAALRTLLLAQRTADEAIAEARAEAESIVAAAREEASSTVTAARDEAASTLSAAREEAGSTLAAAREEAEGTVTRSREDAARADRELAERRAAALDDLERQRVRLEADVEELRAFEREYRTRLRAYLEGQLRDLDGAGGSDEIGVGVPVGAGDAAVGRPEGGAVRISGPSALASAVPLRAVPAADDPADPAPAASTAEH